MADSIFFLLGFPMVWMHVKHCGGTGFQCPAGRGSGDLQLRAELARQTLGVHSPRWRLGFETDRQTLGQVELEA